jgi:O-antigen biosynthesis protein
MGRIYTRAGLGLEVGRPVIHHGIFGTGFFQTIYSAPQVWWPLLFLSPEWWFLALSMLGLAPVWNPAASLAQHGLLGAFAYSPFANPLFLLPIAMLAITLGIAWLVAGQASPPVHQRRFWSRLLIAAMHVAQPVERGWARYKARFTTIEIPDAFHALRVAWERRRAGRLLARRQVGLWSETGVGREKLLESLLALAAENQWFVRVDPGWDSHDVRFYGDRWCKTDLCTVTENHGGGKMLTRVRLEPAPTLFQRVLWVTLGYVWLMAWCVGGAWTLAATPVVLGLLLHLRRSERRLNAVVVATLLTVAEQSGMTVVGWPDAFKRPLPAPGRGEMPLPTPASARTVNVFSLPPLLARAAGIVTPRRAAAR